MANAPVASIAYTSPPLGSAAPDRPVAATSAYPNLPTVSNASAPSETESSGSFANTVTDPSPPMR